MNFLVPYHPDCKQTIKQKKQVTFQRGGVGETTQQRTLCVVPV